MSYIIDVNDLIGKPFLKNGRGPDSYDCLGLIIEVRKRLNRPLFEDITDSPNEITSQHELFEIMSKSYQALSHWLPGCIVTFCMKPKIVTHVGVVLNSSGQFIHVFEKRNVAIERLGHVWWSNKIEGYYELPN